MPFFKRDDKFTFSGSLIDELVVRVAPQALLVMISAVVALTKLLDPTDVADGMYPCGSQGISGDI